MRALRLNPTKEGYAFIATMAIRDKKTYLISRTLDTMKQVRGHLTRLDFHTAPRKKTRRHQNQEISSVSSTLSLQFDKFQDSFRSYECQGPGLGVATLSSGCLVPEFEFEFEIDSEQEGFSAEDVEYVRAVILEELPDNLKHQAEGTPRHFPALSLCLAKLMGVY